MLETPQSETALFIGRAQLIKSANYGDVFGVYYL